MHEVFPLPPLEELGWKKNVKIFVMLFKEQWVFKSHRLLCVTILSVAFILSSKVSPGREYYPESRASLSGRRQCEDCIFGQGRLAD